MRPRPLNLAGHISATTYLISFKFPGLETNVFRSSDFHWNQTRIRVRFLPQHQVHLFREIWYVILMLQNQIMLPQSPAGLITAHTFRSYQTWRRGPRSPSVPFIQGTRPYGASQCRIWCERLAWQWCHLVHYQHHGLCTDSHSQPGNYIEPFNAWNRSSSTQQFNQFTAHCSHLWIERTATWKEFLVEFLLFHFFIIW